MLAAHRLACQELDVKCGGKLAATDLSRHEVDFSKSWRPNHATPRLRPPPGSAQCRWVKLHHLRHFGATHLLSLGIDIRTVRGRLGHTNASKKLDFYAQFL